MKVEILVDGSYIKHGHPKNPYQLELSDRQDFPDAYAETLIDMEVAKEVKGVFIETIETAKSIISPPKDDIKATTSVKKFAEKEGVNLALVEGTGQDGRIKKSDVENYLKDK